jgi:hypothetical protein
MQFITRPALFISTLLLTLLYSVSASAYIFGPPPVTELTESGENLDNISLFKREESFVYGTSGTPTKFESTGLAGLTKKGDKDGAFNFMYRLSKEKAPAFATYDSTNLGFGFGRDWNVLSDRSLGIILNGQFDYARASESVTSGKTTYSWDYSITTLGVETGAVYRLFINQATIAPFVMYNIYRNTNSVTPSVGRAYSIYYDGSSVNLGVSVILGKFNLTYTQTTSEAKYSYDIYTGSGTVKTTGNMLTLGFNY